MRIAQTAFAGSMIFAVSLSPAQCWADELESTVSLMSKIASANSPSFSPDGKRIAFVSNITGIPQVWTVPTGGGWPELVTASEDPVGTVAWSPQRSVLAFSLAPGGGMNEQVYLVHPHGTGLRRLTSGGKETNQRGLWSRDGRLLAVASNQRSGAAIDAYVYSVDSNALRLVSQSEGTSSFVDLSKDNKFALLDRVIGRGDNNLFLVEIATGKETLLTPHSGPCHFEGVFSPDRRWVYLSTDRDRDRAAFARLALSSVGIPGRLEWLWARDDAELESFAIDEQGSMAALNWNVAGESELAFYDLRSSKRKSLPKLPGEIAGGLTFSRDGRLLAVTLSGAARPTDIWTVNVSTGAMTQATQSPHAGVDLKSLVRPELRRFAAHDGLQLSGWLYLPATGKAPFPMVFWFHGGPESEERPRFNSLYQAMLAGGMAIFAPNVRGSTGFGKRFVNLDNGALRFDGIRDIKSCVAYVVQQGLADEKRIGIMGASYGGYMTMAGLTEYPELFAAGADLFGVVNFETFFKHTEPWMASISKTEYGDPEREADLLRRLSPIHKLDRVVAPTLVIHGANDTNVPVEEADQVVDNLKKRNIPVEYLLFPDEGHGIRKTSNRIRAITAIVRWFDKYLKGAVGRSDH